MTRFLAALRSNRASDVAAVLLVAGMILVLAML